MDETNELEFTLTTSDLATTFNLDKDTVVEYCNAGKIPHLRLTRYTFRFKKADVLKWIAERYVTSSEHPLVKHPGILPKPRGSAVHPQTEATRAKISTSLQAYFAQKKAAEAKASATT